MLAYPLLVLAATGSVAQMGLITAVSGLGRTVSGLVVGPLIDKRDRKRIMIVCDVSRAVLYTAIPVVWIWAQPLWLLYFTAGVGSCLAMGFRVAHVSTVAALVGRDQVVAANSRLETTSSMSYILGPVAAGALVGLVGAQNALSVDALSFAVSAVTVALVRVIAPPARPRDGRDPYAPVSGESRQSGFRAGFVYLWRHEPLRYLTILLTGTTLLTLAGDDVVIYWLQRHLRDSTRVTGLVFGCASLGGLGAAVGASWLRGRLGFVRCWFGSYTVVGVSMLTLGLTRAGWQVALMAIAFVFGTTLAGICSMSYRQQVTPEYLLGRVTATFWTVSTSLAPLGAAAVTWLAQQHGVPVVAAGTGGACLVILALGLFTPLARAHEPAGDPEAAA